MRLDRTISLIALATVMGVTAWLAAADWAHADHELPKPPPLWFLFDDVERLALIEVPAGMV